MQHEIAAKLGIKAKKRLGEDLKEARVTDFEYDNGISRKRESKAEQKELSLKKKYDLEIQSQKTKKFSNSSFLTPEAAMYLNEAIRDNQTKVDEEVIYAGLHSGTKTKGKFDRKEKYATRHKQRGIKRRRKGKFG
jgi:hypothetical protein